jgi:hypothetical protein
MFKLLSCILILGGLIFGEEIIREWKLERSRNNVKIFTRSSEISGVNEVKAETTVNSNLSAIVKLLTDIESYPKWIYQNEKSEIIKQVSDTEYYIYQVTWVPWPAKNRDMITHVKFKQDKKTKTVYMLAVADPDYIPEKPSYVRIQRYNATWTITPSGDGTVDLINEIAIDPGGGIPSWMANLAIIEGPYTTTLNLRKKIQEPDYKNAKVDFIKEL